MAATWQRLLRIEPGEGLRVAQFAALGLLLQAGLAFGSAGADALFLTNVGADKLPHIYLLMPLLMAGYIPAYSFLLGRWGVARVFDLTLGLLVAGGLVLWLLFQNSATGGATWLFYTAKLYSALWYVGIYSLFWNFVDGYFDLRDAKRLFALFAAGMAIGAIIGGSLVAPISDSLGVAPLFLAWSATAFLAWPLLAWSRRTTRPIPAEDDEVAGAGSGLREIVHTLGHLGRSPYALALTLLLFGTLVTATLCEYQYMGVFADGLDEADLAGLFGQLNAMVNVLNLAITLLFFNRLVGRLGVTGVAFIQPVTYTLVFTWLLLDRGFLSAAAGFVAFQGIMTAIDYNNVNLLFSGLPAARRKQLRTLIEGFAEPLATATAGLFLFVFGGGMSPANLSMVGVLAALGCLALAFIVQACFGAAITANRRASWLDFSRALPASPPPPSAATAPAPGSLDASDLTDPAHRAAVLHALLALPLDDLARDDEFLPALLRVIEAGPPPVRLLALDVLERLGDADATTELLRCARHYRPAEQRRVEQVLLSFGPRITPVLSHIAESPAFPVQGRRLALRTLGRLSPAQAHAIADPLIVTTLRRAYRARGNFFVLAQVETSSPAHAVLLRLNRDLPKLALEIVLEALSVADRLSGPEAIFAALFSDASKERGYAVESLEQACPRPVFDLLLPLLDDNTIAAQVALGHAQGLIEDIDLAAVLSHSLGSAFPLEVSAAAQMLRDLHGPAADPQLLAALAAQTEPLLRDTLTTLWQRPLDPAAPPTPVELAHHLMRWPELRGALFTHFEMLVPQARIHEVTTPRVLLSPATASAGAWQVLAGRIESSASGPAGGPGAVVGLTEFLTAAPPPAPVVAAAGSRLLHLPAEALRETARTHPAFGLVLLRHHLQVAPAP